MQIVSKEIAYKIYNQGLLFNRLNVWNSVKELLNSGYKGTVSIRYKGGSRGSGFYAYSVPVSEVRKVVEEWKSKGALEERIVFNESAPDEYLTIQGEITYNPQLELFYSTEKKKMNEALKNGISASGLKARIMLKHYMDPMSYADTMALLEMFPEHVIEFSTYSINLGIIPHRNTIIWEIRKY